MYIVTDAEFNTKFWSRIEREGDCWLWTGPTVNTGYGTVSRYRRHILAHRFAYELTHGPIPEGMKVCHTCDHIRCINPAHLFTGTQKDNVDDMIAKGRAAGWAKDHPRGSAHGRAKINEDQVREIRVQRARGIPRATVAATFGISMVSVDKIVYHETWQHVDPI